MFCFSPIYIFVKYYHAFRDSLDTSDTDVYRLYRKNKDRLRHLEGIAKLSKLEMSKMDDKQRERSRLSSKASWRNISQSKSFSDPKLSYLDDRDFVD